MLCFIMPEMDAQTCKSRLGVIKIKQYSTRSCKNIQTQSGRLRRPLFQYAPRSIERLITRDTATCLVKFWFRTECIPIDYFIVYVFICTIHAQTERVLFRTIGFMAAGDLEEIQPSLGVCLRVRRFDFTRRAIKLQLIRRTPRIIIPLINIPREQTRGRVPYPAAFSERVRPYTVYL